MTPLKITCYSLNCIFTGVEYNEVRLSKARVVNGSEENMFLSVVPKNRYI